MDANGPGLAARPQVVRMAARLLEQAERGEISSLVIVKFKTGGNVDFASEFTEAEDLADAGTQIRELHRSTVQFARRVSRKPAAEVPENA